MPNPNSPNCIDTDHGAAMWKRKWRRFAWGLTVIAAVAATAEAKAADVVLVNQSGFVLDQLYISPCVGAHWGPNQLIGAPVESSRSFTVSNIAPGCYDLKVVLPPLNSCIINGAAVFKRLVWTITWSTATEAAFDDCSRTAHIVSVGRRPWLPYGAGQ
jgi:hypothetical protein